MPVFYANRLVGEANAELRLWCRFFLLAVFATMYIRDVGRKEFYEALGLNAREYDKYVIEKTNETSARVFPVILDVSHSSFYERLEKIIQNNKKLSKIDNSNSPKMLKKITKLPTFVSNGYELLRLYLLKPLNSKDFQPSIR